MIKQRACFAVGVEDVGWLVGQGWIWSGQSMPTCVHFKLFSFFFFLFAHCG